MRFVKQKNPIKSIVVEKEEGAANEKRHGKLLPNNIRALLMGPSGCGKTSCILNLILSPVGLRMAHLIIYSKSLHQPKYCFLKKIFKNNIVSYKTFSNSENILSKIKTLSKNFSP